MCFHLLGVVVDLGEERGARVGAGEDVAPAAAHPGVVVEAEERGVDAHAAAALVHAVRVARAHPRHQRHPRRELPRHLHVEVGGVLQLLE